MITKKCEKCLREITINNFDRHYKSCQIKEIKEKISNDLIITLNSTQFQYKICNKIFSKHGIKSHIWKTHTEKGKQSKTTGKPTWNKGLTADTDYRVLNGVKKLNLFYKEHPGFYSGKKHSFEEKLHLSMIRKKYLMEHPDKVPYLLNHSSKESYPEKYFAEVFKNEKLNVVRYFQVSLYQIDFAIPNIKIAIEIDGEQHYVDDKVKKCDSNKEKFLNNLGWKIYRIRWSLYKKLSKEQKIIFIQNLICQLKS